MSRRYQRAAHYAAILRDARESGIDRQRQNAREDALGLDRSPKLFTGTIAQQALRFDRSGIHSWGVYAEEPIQAQEEIIEYIGERVRQRIVDLR
jgi:histone-lysine N-methyltransferase SETD1